MFKEGDQIVAIEDDHYLTKGKIYIVKQVSIDNIDNTNSIIFIRANEGISQWYGGEDFISLLEYRKQKINKIKEKIKQKICTDVGTQ